MKSETFVSSLFEQCSCFCYSEQYFLSSSFCDWNGFRLWHDLSHSVCDWNDLFCLITSNLNLKIATHFTLSCIVSSRFSRDLLRTQPFFCFRQHVFTGWLLEFTWLLAGSGDWQAACGATCHLRAQWPRVSYRVPLGRRADQEFPQGFRDQFFDENY